MGRLRSIVALLGIGFFAGTCAAQELQLKPGTFCWAMHFAGVVPGITTGPQVARLLGGGAYRPQEGDTGVRYFVNTPRTATLRIETCTYRIVCEMSLESGVPPTLSASEQSRALSAHFDLAEGFGNWHKLSLGSVKADVIANLGTPSRKDTEDSWVYESQCACELPEYMTLVFSGNRIVRVVFSAPAG